MVSFIFLLFIFASINKPIWCQNRIVGGQDAKISDFPFMIYIIVDNGKAICSGSIISEKWGLSAGHCFEGIGTSFTTEDYTVISGDAYIGQTDPISSTRGTHTLKQYYLHENFSDHGMYGYDISVFEVNEPFVFGPNTSSIQLPSNDMDVNAPSARIAGWGCKEYKTAPINYLKYTWLVKYSDEKCTTNYYRFIKETESVFCYTAGKNTTGNPGNGCPGDSGGPLFTEDTVIGITTMVVVGDIYQPTCFTKVQFYRDWIKEKTNI